MILVDHYVGQSAIHGLGVFTREDIRAGAPVWKYDPMFDVDVPVSLYQCLPPEMAETLRHHAEYIEHLGIFRIGNDGDIFMNHADRPSLIDRGEIMFAAQDLPAGSELTCDYRIVRVLGYEEPEGSSVCWAAE